MKPTLTLALSLAALISASTPALAQQDQLHPSKRAFADLPDWPATSPGAVTLPNFRPFRAVYERQYTQGSGAGKGEPRHDRVIVSAESVGWDGQEAIAIQILDSAVPEHPDTNARNLLMVVRASDLSVLFETGPIPGSGKDYYFARYETEHALLSYVMTESQEFQAQKPPIQVPGFGPGTWVMAAMPLVPEGRIRLHPFFSPKANPVAQSDHGIVLDQKTVADGSGQSHSAWVVESMGWFLPTSPKTLRLHLKDQPPYLVGIQTFNHDTQEAKPFVWLRDFQLGTP